MRKRILLLPLLLSACSSKIDSQNIQNSLYEGYPCFEYCEAFQKGFESAEIGKLTSTDECGQLAEKEQLGCEAFIHEYKIETEGDFIIDNL